MTKIVNQKFFDSIIETLITLEGYDKSNIKLKDKTKELNIITEVSALKLIELTKEQLEKRGESVTFFGKQNNPKNLDSIIQNLYSTFDNAELYPTFEDKAANLIYLVIKDHPFIDGNKRIGTLLFDYYCQINDKVIPITPSLPIQIANSNPKEKELIITLLVALIQSSTSVKFIKENSFFDFFKNILPNR
jgi:prophage maintenance system killer protein